MYTVPSLISQKGNNFGSSNRYIKYMTKDTNGLLFDSKGNEIDEEIATELMDKNSRGGIRKGEAKWYSPVYSLSEAEALHVADSILTHGSCESRGIEKFQDLTEQEQKMYNLKVQHLAMEFQNEMAKNFHKQNLGIESKDDILWYGVVENKRHYTGYDADVKSGKAKQNDEKIGFNTHIHIVQSRKALNEKKSLISPMANARAKTKQGAGFDRNIFYNKIEQSFDAQTNYKREVENTFEHYKAQTKTQEYWKKQGYFQNSTLENRKPKYAKNFQKNVDREVIKNSRCVDYFFYLEKRGLVEFDKKKGNNYYFKKKGQHSGSISVSEKGWKDFSSDQGGGILKAIQIWDKFDWVQSISLIKSLSNEYEQASVEQSVRKIEEVKQLKNLYLINYIEKRGINYSLAEKYLKQVHYSVDQKPYYSVGFQNNSKGFALRSPGFKSNLNSQDITSLNFENSKQKKVLLFEGFFNYLSYVQIYGKSDQKVVIMNSTGNYKKLINFLNTNAKNETIEYYGDNDKAGDLLLKKINGEKIKTIDKRYLYSTFGDLNNYVIDKLKAAKMQEKQARNQEKQQTQNTTKTNTIKNEKKM